jgi:hypothetical protein
VRIRFFSNGEDKADTWIADRLGRVRNLLRITRASEFISNSSFVGGLKNTNFIGFFETVLLEESTELQRKWRLRERIYEKATFQGAEVGLRMLQIQRVFSPQIRNREPFATGWWRREWDSNPRYGFP